MLHSELQTPPKESVSGPAGGGPVISRRTRYLGLAVGSSRLILAAEGQDGYRYSIQKNCYVSIPHSNLTQRTLENQQIPLLVRNGRILVYGNESETLAELFQLEPHRPMREGVFNTAEPDSEDHLLRLIASITGPSGSDPTHLCFTVPSAGLERGDEVEYQIAAVGRLAARLGAKTCHVEEGLAVVYSELKDTNYTGLAITFGAGLCNVCLAYLSVPVMSFSVAGGGDQIDEQAARITGESPLRTRLFKEQQFRLSGSAARGSNDPGAERRSRVLSIYYEQMMRSVVAALAEQVTGRGMAPKLDRPIPVVLAGGSAACEGFASRFEQILLEARLPLPISQVRLAENPAASAARGALVAALSEM